MALAGVTAVTARYRMTNKPPPQQPSPYVQEILGPLKKFLDKFAASAEETAAATRERWLTQVAELITSQFLQRVQALIETVRSMDVALNKRAKMKPSAAAGGNASTMSDSEKILLQLYLDVQSYYAQIAEIGAVSSDIPSLEPLLNAVAVADPAKAQT